MNRTSQDVGDALHYRLPEDAYHQLWQTRDHLYLLARLTDARTQVDEAPGRELPIAPAPLAHCFRQIADQLNHCLQETLPPTPSMQQ